MQNGRLCVAVVDSALARVRVSSRLLPGSRLVFFIKSTPSPWPEDSDYDALTSILAEALGVSESSIQNLVLNYFEGTSRRKLLQNTAYTWQAESEVRVTSSSQSGEDVAQAIESALTSESFSDALESELKITVTQISSFEAGSAPTTAPSGEMNLTPPSGPICVWL